MINNEAIEASHCPSHPASASLKRIANNVEISPPTLIAMGNPQRALMSQSLIQNPLSWMDRAIDRGEVHFLD